MGNFNVIKLNKSFEELPFLEKHFNLKTNFYDYFETKNLLKEWSKNIKPGGICIECGKDNRLYYVKKGKQIPSKHTGEIILSYYSNKYTSTIDFIVYLKNGFLKQIDLK